MVAVSLCVVRGKNRIEEQSEQHDVDPLGLPMKAETFLPLLICERTLRLPPIAFDLLWTVSIHRLRLVHRMPDGDDDHGID